MKSFFINQIFFGLGLTCVILLCSNCGQEELEPWHPLFNGTNLDNWSHYLSVPDSSLNIPDWPRDSTGHYEGPLRQEDPLHVFSIDTLNGEPVLRISGAVIGNLYTKETFANYHLRLQFRWGHKKWSRMQGRPRDGGILYHYSRVEGKGIRHELQIHEGDVGSYWAKHTFVDIPGSYITDLPQSIREAKPYLKDLVPTLGDTLLRFNGDSSWVHFAGADEWQISLANPYNENPAGQWNTLEILAHENHVVHVVNGRVNMILLNAHYREDGVLKPMNSGSIQLQSEGAELFFRQVEWKPLGSRPRIIEDLLKK